MAPARVGQHLHQAFCWLLQLPQRILLALVLVYRWTLKPWLGNACRFEPSCSQYALDALRQHGAVVGASLSTWRLLRCHPWCDGGCDPVPQHAPRLFSHLGLSTEAAGPAAPTQVPVQALIATPRPVLTAPSAPASPMEPKPLAAGPGMAAPSSTHSPTINPLS